jgi:hypothetical protein
VAELDARASEVGYLAHYMSQSLQVLVDEGKQVMRGGKKHLALEEGRQRWPVLLLVGTVPKQVVQVGTRSRHVQPQEPYGTGR